MTDEEKDWQTNHGNFIEAFLLFLNKQTDQFVLKGGTALSLCYGLDRLLIWMVGNKTSKR